MSNRDLQKRQRLIDQIGGPAIARFHAAWRVALLYGSPEMMVSWDEEKGGDAGMAKTKAKAKKTARKGSGY